MIVEPLLVFQ